MSATTTSAPAPTTGTGTTSTKPGALPLSETLRDLALLRASDVDLAPALAAAAIPAQTPAPGDAAVDASVDASYELAREARAAVRLLDRGEVDRQGARVDALRGVLEEVLAGVGPGTK
jgi:hypothetical protein